MSLKLDDRSRAILAEMGVKVWAPRARSAPDLLPRPLAGEGRGEGAPAIQTIAASARQSSASGQRPVETLPAANTALGPRPQGVESMNWPQLQEAVAGCRACALCAGRTQTVFGVGSRTANWMAVGEAPGENEDRQGQPFVGQAGKLLDNMLAAVGLSRHAELAIENDAAGADQESAKDQKDTGKKGVYIANVLKCRPPGNRNPQPEEVAQCEPYLRRQVALVQPKIILAMGRFAVQSLLQTTEPIGRLRGRVHRYEGVPVIVTYHPAYLLRALPEKAKAWQDLCLALKVAGEPQSPAGG